MENDKTKKKSNRPHQDRQRFRDQNNRQEIPKRQDQGAGDFSRIENDVVEFRRLYSSTLDGRSTSPELIKEFYRLLLASDPNVIQKFIEIEWQETDGDCREIFLKELQALPSDRLIAIKVAKIVARYKDEWAARMLVTVLGEKGLERQPYFSNLSREKKESIKFHFFAPNIPFQSISKGDEQVNRLVLILFVMAASDIADFGRGGYIGLARNLVQWAMELAPNAALLDAERDFIAEQIKIFNNRLPENVRVDFSPPEAVPDLQSEPKTVSEAIDDELVQEVASDDVVQQRSTESVSETSPDVKKEQDSAAEGTDVVSEAEIPKSVKDKTVKRVVVERREPKRPEPKAADLSNVERLIAHKQQIQATLQEEITVLSRFVVERNELKERLRVFEDKVSDAYDENEKLNGLLKGLRVNFDDLEAELLKTTRERDDLLTVKKSLTETVTRINADLAARSNSLSAERDEYKSRSKDEVTFELSQFRSRLAQKLKVIFDNKRTTDGYEPSIDLAEFLRGLLDEIESVLIKNGIQP